MHPLSERDRAKKDYGKVELKTKGIGGDGRKKDMAKA